MRSQQLSTALSQCHRPSGHRQHSPANVELHVGIEEADHRRGCCFPALDPGSDQPLPFVVAHDLHQARVPLMDVLVQVKLQLNCRAQRKPTHTFRVRNALQCCVLFCSRKGEESLNIPKPLVSLTDNKPWGMEQLQEFQPREIPHTPETCPNLIWPDGFEYSVEEVVCLRIFKHVLFWFSDDLH